MSEWVIECHSSASKSPWHDYVIHELKIRKYPWTWFMTGGSWNRSEVGVHGPLVHVLSFGSKAITGSSFQIWVFSSLICLLPGWLVRIRGKFLWRIRHPAGSWMAAAKIFLQFRQVAWASDRRLITHLIACIKSINAMGSDVTVLTFQCLCSSFDI